MPQIARIRKGESLKVFIGRNGDESIDGYTCVIEVHQEPGDSAVVGPRTITAKENDKFKVILTQTETAALDTGFYYLTARLSKTGTDEEEQQRVRFQLGEAWV